MGLFDKTLFSNCIQNGNSITHLVNKIRSDRFVDSDNIFFFVTVSSAKYLIYNITIVGQQNQPFTWFVKSSNWKNPNWIIDKINNIVFFHSGISSANNPFGFIKCKIDILVFGIV